MLEPAMFIGLGAVAVWTHVRFPRLRPGSLDHAALARRGVVRRLRAAARVTERGAPASARPAPRRPYVVLVLLILVLTYLLLSWVWLIAQILHDLSGNGPRGGHTVSSES